MDHRQGDAADAAIPTLKGKLILRSFLSPVHITLMTAAVRDLHRCYPGQFLTDVRTGCPELWENNPYLTPLNERDSGVRILQRDGARSPATLYHKIHSYIDDLNQQLGLQISPTEFRGDIHLSDRDKAWPSQIQKWPAPYWIIVAGGDPEITTRWWSQDRWQKVVDHFRGRIQFVQIDESGHRSHKLKGVIDLGEQTNWRDVVRLLYHAQGVLSPVTTVPHLSAAIEYKYNPKGIRPCVVIAGGRDTAHQEAYPGHQYICKNGALPCAPSGGCGLDRVPSPGQSNIRNMAERYCQNPVGNLPRCMDMINVDSVIRTIQLYFDGGVTKFLEAADVRARTRPVGKEPRAYYPPTDASKQPARRVSS